MSEPRTIVLPKHEEMLRRLLSLEDEPHLVSNFYPKLLVHAGKPMTALDVILMFQFAIFDYSMHSPELSQVRYSQLRYTVKALIDDDDMCKEVFGLLGVLGL
jgi:hypothetical protein